MAFDPLNTPADRMREWKAYLLGGAVISLIFLGGKFATTGEDHLVNGTVVRLEKVGAKQLDVRAIVRLDNGGQIATSLPSLTNCRTGSTIELVRRDNIIGRSFRPAVAACAD